MTLMSDPYHHLIYAIKLSQDHQSHNNGEQALQSLRQHPEYPLILIQAAAETSFSIGDRQLIYILLKQLVRQSWDSDEISPEYKFQIRKSIVDQMRHVIDCRPLLTQCCLLIASIAEYDLQTQEWPELLPALLGYISIPSLAPASVYCMSLLVSDLPQDHLVEISQHFYPVLTDIFANGSNPALLRYQSMCIFSGLVDSISCAEDEQECLRTILCDHVSTWFQMLITLFSDPMDTHQLGFGLYIEGCDLVSILIRALPLKNRETYLQALPDLMQCILQFTMSLLPIYQKQYINEQTDDDPGSNESFEGVERSSLSHLFTSVSDLLSIMAWPISKSASQFMLKHLDQIVQLAIVTLQVPFGEDPLYEEDVEYSTSYSTRSSSIDLISRLHNFLTSEKSNQTLNMERYSRNCLIETSNWKMIEVGLILLGQISPIPDDIFPLVAELTQHSNNHIRIRALWVMKQILLSSEYSDIIFQSVVNGILSNICQECEPVRLTAADCMSAIPIERLSCIGDPLSYILQQICYSLQIATSQDHIFVFLNAVRILLNISQVRQAHFQDVSHGLMEIWAQHVHDGLVTSRLAETLCVLCAPDTIRSLQMSLVPTICNILKQCDASAYEGLMDLLSQLIAPCESILLPDELCALVTPLIVHILSSTDDLAIVTSCLNCLINLTRNATDQVASSLTSIMPVVYTLLQNRNMVVPIGNLIYTIVKIHYSRFQEHDVRTLLHLLQDRILMSGSSFATVGDSILALSKMIHSFHATNILHLLCELNGSSPERLNQLFKKWVELYDDAHSPYLKSITMLALSQIGRVRRPEIDSIIVPGYQIVDTNAPRRTRSQGPATAVVNKQISLLAKIISLLLSQLIRSNSPSDESSDSQDSEHDKGVFDQLFSDFLEDDDEGKNKSLDEVIFADDPLTNTDLSMFVPNFIREISNNQPEAAKWCFDQLAVNDQIIFQKCLNGVI